MTFSQLAHSYFVKARSRRRALPLFLQDENYSDVVREAQETVELCLKGTLRFLGVDPPRWHDVGPVLLENRDRLPPGLAGEAEDLAAISMNEADRVLDFFHRLLEGDLPLTRA